MKICRRQLLASVAAAALVLSLPLDTANAILKGSSFLTGRQQNPSFTGNPYVNITAIDVTGGIACSRSGTIYTPAFIMVSASAITATGTSIPYEDLEFTWDFGDPIGTEVFTNPITQQKVNANAGQRGGEAAYCYRVAGTYTVTLTVRGSDGAGGIGATATKTLSLTITDFASLSGMTDWYYDLAASGSNNGTSPTNAFTCMTGGLPDMTNMSAKLSVAKARLNIKRGSVWTITPDTPGTTRDSYGVSALYLASSQTRMQPYGNGANPIIKCQNNLVAFHATIDNGSGSAGTVLTVTSVLPNSAAIKVGQFICVDGSGTTNKITALGSGSGGTGTYTVQTSQLKADFAMSNLPVSPIHTHPNVASLDDFVASNIDFQATGNQGVGAVNFVWSDIPTSNIYFDNCNPVIQLDAAAVFTGSISSDNVLHVTAISSGTIFPNNSFGSCVVSDATGNIDNAVVTGVTGFLTGTEGGVGTYSTNNKAQTVASEAMELRPAYGQMIRYQPSEVQNPTGAATNMGFWGGSATSGSGDRGVGTGFFAGARNWNFVFGWSVTGEGGDPIRDHHIYPDQQQHALYRWINFGSGKNRSFCINTNWDNNNNNASLQFVDYILMSDNWFSGVQFGHDGSDGNNSSTNVQFRNFVNQLNAYHGLASGGALFSCCSVISITWRYNNVSGCNNGSNWAVNAPVNPSIAALVKPKVYGNNFYRTVGNTYPIMQVSNGTYTQPWLVKNNKFYDTEATAFCVAAIPSDQVTAVSSWDLNTYYGPNRGDQKLFTVTANNGTAATFSTWKTAGAAINMDANSTVANPNWPDPANGIFA